MKRILLPFISILIVSLVLFGCAGGSSDDAQSISNFDQANDTLDRPAVGPDSTEGEIVELSASDELVTDSSSSSDEDAVSDDVSDSDSGEIGADTDGSGDEISDIADSDDSPNNSATPAEPETQVLGMSIADNAVNVEGNTPVSVTFNNSIDFESIDVNNVYIVNEKGEKIYARIVVEDNIVTIIPQIRQQPRATYTAVFSGIADDDGNDFDTISITYTNDDLDFGLYWYGKYGLCEKYIPGVENAFYDPESPTVIFSHGWQADSVKQTDPYGREGYRYEIFYWVEDSFNGKKKYNGLKQWTNHSWIDKGWNTGIVYWNQFADEPSFSAGNGIGVPAAEEKIWSFNGCRGSRYRILNDSGNAVYKNFNKVILFDDEYVSVGSVGDILGMYVIDALSNNTSGNIRLVGHSLGNQVVNNLGKQCLDNGIRLDRIALLDPAWIQGAKNFFPNDGYGKWTGERCRNYLYEMENAWSGFAYAIYHTTAINLAVTPIADSNEPLKRSACDVNNAPWYYSATQLAGKHISIRHSYFWSMASSAPTECTISWWRRKKTGNVAASAATSTSRIKEMMGSRYQWTQVEGRYTPDPGDDWFERKKN